MNLLPDLSLSSSRLELALMSLLHCHTIPHQKNLSKNNSSVLKQKYYGCPSKNLTLKPAAVS